MPRSYATSAIASSSSGGSLTPNIPSGVVNGTNTVFTATSTPLFVVADGSTYFNGAGYTLVGLTITMDNAPTQYIRYFTGSPGPVAPIGPVNGTNTVFTATATPSFVVADGSTYFNGAGYTLVGLTITMDNAPTQYIRYFT